MMCCPRTFYVFIVHLWLLVCTRFSDMSTSGNKDGSSKAGGPCRHRSVALAGCPERRPTSDATDAEAPPDPDTTCMALVSTGYDDVENARDANSTQWGQLSADRSRCQALDDDDSSERYVQRRDVTRSAPAGGQGGVGRPFFGPISVGHTGVPPEIPDPVALGSRPSVMPGYRRYFFHPSGQGCFLPCSVFAIGCLLSLSFRFFSSFRLLSFTHASRASALSLWGLVSVLFGGCPLLLFPALSFFANLLFFFFANLHISPRFYRLLSLLHIWPWWPLTYDDYCLDL